MSDQIIIFDTTLRDGEQALQASLSVKEKLQIALALERMQVDVMEVGFPISSPGDFESVQTIAKTIKNSRVCALSRCIDKDIDVAAEALKVADQFRIHTFMATSTLHVKDKLKMTFEDVVEQAVHCVKRARNYTDDVEFSCEDAGRTPIDNLSVHCHDDLGMSVANSISAIQEGAKQIEGAMNGLGERAGNTALEEVIMAIKVRQNILNVHTNINHQEIYRTSQIVSQITNTPIPSNKAVIGSNAFAHSSGIHQDGVLKNRETYEIMTPESIGLNQIQLNLTSRSGRAAVKHRLAELGYQDNDYNLDQVYQAFLELADKKGQVFDYDLEALIFINQIKDDEEHYVLDYFNVQSGSTVVSTASVSLIIGDQKYSDAATGNGPVDAVYQAINRITGEPISIVKYQLASKGQGENALGQVDIVAEYKGRKFHGVGLATDIVHSSALALINVLNNVYRANQVAEQKQKLHQY